MKAITIIKNQNQAFEVAEARVKAELTDASLGQVKQVDEVPVLAEGVVSDVVRPLEDVASRAAEGGVVQLKQESIEPNQII